MKIPLTVGMACWLDYSGVYLTIQSLLQNHAQPMRECELLLVDNCPGHPHEEKLRGLFNWISNLVRVARYIPYATVQGTAAPRQLLMEEAQGLAVLVMDPHILPAHGSILGLLDYYHEHPETPNLLSGPMEYDDHRTVATDFADVWADKMWGQWNTDMRGMDRKAPAYEIGAQGLGLFSCRKRVWPGFNRRFRGFGGEEWYIHEKFRQAGGKCLCLPWLRWLHLSMHPDGVKYVNTVEHRCRNYLIGLNELGIPLDRCRCHYVEEEGLGEEWFNRIVDDVNQHRDSAWDVAPQLAPSVQPGVQALPGTSVVSQSVVLSSVAVLPAPEKGVVHRVQTSVREA